MKTLLAITKKEYRDFFFSPIAYVFMTVFLLIVLWVFFSDFFVRSQASLRLFFSWVPLVFLVFLPAVTMGKWSEEKRQGTMELLLTLPLKDWHLVMGKFFASLLFLLTTLAFTLPLVFTVSFLGDLDMGPVIGGYLGLIFLGASSIAIGLTLSSLTKNSIIAFILSFLILFLLYLIGEPLILNLVPDFLGVILANLSLNYHFQSIARGVIDSRDIIYYFSVIGFFLYANLLSLESRHWES